MDTRWFARDTRNQGGAVVRPRYQEPKKEQPYQSLSVVQKLKRCILLDALMVVNLDEICSLLPSRACAIHSQIYTQHQDTQCRCIV